MNTSLALTCSCHVINPHKTPILAWLRKDKLLVKIADQHFLAIPRTDKNGERYWKCKEFAEESQTEQVNNSQ